MVRRILSEKLVDVTSVATPLTRPEASRDLEGNDSSLTSMPSILNEVIVNVWRLTVSTFRELLGHRKELGLERPHHPALSSKRLQVLAVGKGRMISVPKFHEFPCRGSCSH